MILRKPVRQAVSVISRMISENRWEQLEGLMTKQALGRLKREVETEWNDARRRYVAMAPSDLKLALPRRVRFARIAGKDRVLFSNRTGFLGGFKSDVPFRSKIRGRGRRVRRLEIRRRRNLQRGNIRRARRQVSPKLFSGPCPPSVDRLSL